MQDQDDLNPAMRELETALKSLTPSASWIDPVAAAFAAGQRSAWRRARFVHSALAAGLVLGVVIWKGTSPGDRPIPHRSSVMLTSSPPALADQSMIVLRRTILESGVEGLPAASVPAVRVMRVNEVF